MLESHRAASVTVSWQGGEPTLMGLEFYRQGMAKDRFTTTPDGEPGLHYLCPGYQAFFHHVDRPMRVMAAALRTGHAADEVMAWCRRQDNRPALRRTGIGEGTATTATAGLPRR